MIVKDIVHDCVLGTDFQNKGNASIIMNKNQVILFKRPYQYKELTRTKTVSTVEETSSAIINDVLRENEDVFSTDA